MKNDTAGALVAVLLAIVGVATVSVLVSSRSQTPGVLSALGTALSNMLCAAMKPVTGRSCGGSLISNVTSSVTFPGA